MGRLKNPGVSAYVLSQLRGDAEYKEWHKKTSSGLSFIIWGQRSESATGQKI